jgi:hypothetical protein
MIRLYEEALARIREMSSILARTHGNRRDLVSAKFVLKAQQSAESNIEFEDTVIVQNCSGDDANCCIIYDYNEGTSTPCA